MSPQAFDAFAQNYPRAAEFLQKDSRIRFQKPPGSFVAAGMERDPAEVLTELKQKFPAAAKALMPDLYDPHAMMTAVLKNMYGKELTYTESKAGSPGFLTRSNGPCAFCVNDPLEIPPRVPVWQTG